MLQEVHCVKENIPMNGVIKGFSAVIQAPKHVFVSFSTIILIYRSKRTSAIPALSSTIKKLKIYG